MASQFFRTVRTIQELIGLLNGRLTAQQVAALSTAAEVLSHLDRFRAELEALGDDDVEVARLSNELLELLELSRRT